MMGTGTEGQTGGGTEGRTGGDIRECTGRFMVGGTRKYTERWSEQAEMNA
eukprot:CAMPEP_0174341366 /NCGR_PEP_ID=MMETSP0810-20121108/25376_1 /TAXON_ID=73025 ORGANISM="Eutreptiella gymnastica-like, Strain CCMP1594" /NCGR_SAMPLE_ID=MMETSP0810 /ASSEMBLY_ACC=CAM_ASM_000659 /LENGTH=49 /DNA_ID=CAMNT_0015463003 /DNA_START=29 /DNA_END=178 /DNA_ORIENTATION=-